MQQPEFWTFVFGVCNRFNGSITSARRTVKHNAAVGGAAQSQHLGWKAADIVWDNPIERPLAEAEFKAAGFWVESAHDAPDHTHVDDRYDATT